MADPRIKARGITREAEAGIALEQDIVRYASPTLARLKPAGLFGCPYTREAQDGRSLDLPEVMLLDEFGRALDVARRRLAGSGVEIEVLARRDNSALLYVCRPDMVGQVLKAPTVANCLKDLGYEGRFRESLLEELAERIRIFDEMDARRDFWDFPHELGYFLGYPPIDVMGFARGRGWGFALDGEWRVYGCPKRVEAMRAHFARLEECKRSYWQLYCEGACIEQLAELGNLR